MSYSIYFDNEPTKENCQPKCAYEASLKLKAIKRSTWFGTTIYNKTIEINHETTSAKISVWASDGIWTSFESKKETWMAYFFPIHEQTFLDLFGFLV